MGDWTVLYQGHHKLFRAGYRTGKNVAQINALPKISRCTDNQLLKKRRKKKEEEKSKRQGQDLCAAAVRKQTAKQAN